VSSGQQDDDGVVNPQRKNVNAIDKTQITTPTLTNSGGKLVLVFTMPAGWTTFNQAFYGPGNGDVLYDDSTGSVFFVRSVAAGPPATITAVLQNNYKVVAGVAQPIVAITFTGGYFWTLVSRYYTPTQFTVGTFSTSAATITGVGAPQGGNSWVTTDIKVNDIIYNDDTRSNLFGSQNGTLTAVAAATLTMSAKSYSNATQQRLALFIRVPPANSTVN
jgi:hypothetical protein